VSWQGLPAGSVLGLLLDLPPAHSRWPTRERADGSLTVYHDGVRVGTMVIGLRPPLCWCAAARLYLCYLQHPSAGFGLPWRCSCEMHNWHALLRRGTACFARRRLDGYSPPPSRVRCVILEQACPPLWLRAMPPPPELEGEEAARREEHAGLLQQVILQQVALWCRVLVLLVANGPHWAV
jgi:hypothetical protein